MAEIKSDFIENIENGKMNYGDVAGGRLRLWRGEIDLSKKTVAAGDTVKILTLPEKGKVVSRRFGSTVSLGTSAVSVGDGTTAQKYRAVAVKTDVTPEELLSPDAEACGETYVLTVATANLPTAGKIWIDVLIADV